MASYNLISPSSCLLKDEKHEEKGIDHPYHYISWTENRNMQEYLRMVEEGKVKLQPIIEKVYDIENAAEAYEVLNNQTCKPLIVLLKYSDNIENKINRRNYNEKAN